MLKHTSSAGGPANGQVRSNATTTTNTARNIHLRPQQPLNISTLNASSLQSPATTTTTNATTLPVNGGPRLTTLLNIASPSSTAPTTNVSHHQQQQQTQPLPPPPAIPLPLPPNGNGNTTTNTATTTTPVTPIINHLTPNGLNGIGNNLHTYTNQHIALAHAAAVANANATTSNGNLINSTVLSPNNNNNNTNHTNYTNYTNPNGAIINQSKHGPGPREALTSLGLLCLGNLKFN